MNVLPEFLRTEIWHPLTVHFPLAILILSTVFYLFQFLIKKYALDKMSSILLIIGTVGAWIAVYTGNMADGVVARKLCDPTAVENHEQAAYLLTWLFTAASILVIINNFGLFKKIRSILSIVIILCMLLGSGFLVYTGHLGAQLVYQQAAGVYTPSEDCNEFAK